MSEKLQFAPALSRLDLITPTMAELLKKWGGSLSVNEIQVAEINPDFAGSAEFCEHYGVNPNEGANCVIVQAKRGTSEFVACLVPINCRVDVNHVVKRYLNARSVSFAPREVAVEKSTMEYGSITPVGLPADWPILIDPAVAAMPRLIIGGGYCRSKLSLPGKALVELPKANVLGNLGISQK